ncbi:MAG: hypothetical protein F7B20_07710 [Aeropyrum sp.]|nr:hypothetical protein [Aeropyrum sp.]MCE4616383.1 hypothetical protein [Aeropyrum sp.]
MVRASSGSARPLLTGVLFVVLGVAIGIVYPYFLMVSGEEALLVIVRYTLILVSIAVGALFIGTGGMIIYGWMKLNAKSYSEE